MKLTINEPTKIKEVQKKFTDAYPYLKLEFYKKPHEEKELSHKKYRISPDKIISSESRTFMPSQISINKNRTVAELEKEVFDKLGIAMQVSRKSGNIWLETSSTDDRTLEMQNQQGQAMSKAPGRNYKIM